MLAKDNCTLRSKIHEYVQHNSWTYVTVILETIFFKCSTHKEVERVIVREWSCIIHNHNGTIQIYTLCTIYEYLLWFIFIYLGGRREFTWQDNMSLGGNTGRDLQIQSKYFSAGVWQLTLSEMWSTRPPGSPLGKNKHWELFANVIWLWSAQQLCWVYAIHKYM